MMLTTFNKARLIVEELDEAIAHMRLLQDAKISNKKGGVIITSESIEIDLPAVHFVTLIDFLIRKQQDYMDQLRADLEAL